MKRLAVSTHSQYGYKLRSAEFTVIRLAADWHFSDAANFFSVDITVMGLAISVTYYPDGAP